MKVTPTSGPIASSSTHQARDATSSRYSLATSQRHEEKTAERVKIAEKKFLFALFAIAAVFSVSGERKEHLFQIGGGFTARPGLRRQFVERAFAANPSPTQQDEPIADALRILDLVNRQEHRPAGRGVRAQGLRDIAALPEIETVERLIGQQQRLRHQQANSEQRTLPLSLGERADRRVE